MNKLFVVIHSTHFIKLFFQEIFYGFYIMVRYALNIFDTLRVSFREVTIDIS